MVRQSQIDFDKRGLIMGFQIYLEEVKQIIALLINVAKASSFGTLANSITSVFDRFVGG